MNIVFVLVFLLGLSGFLLVFAAAVFDFMQDTRLRLAIAGVWLLAISQSIGASAHPGDIDLFMSTATAIVALMLTLLLPLGSLRPYRA